MGVLKKQICVQIITKRKGYKMAYNNGGYQNRGGYNNNNQGGGYNRGGNGSNYNSTQYTPPAKKEFNLDDECSKYGIVYLQLKESLESQGISLEEVHDFLGGWTTTLKINLDKS